MPYLFFIFLLSSFISLEEHEFHFSKFEIEHNEERKSLEISMRVFIDDLESGIIQKQGLDKLKLYTDNESPDAQKYIEAYLNETFKIYHNDEPLPLQFIGKELSKDLSAVWCYVEVELPSNSGAVVIKNQILLDRFEDQKNMIRFASDKHGKLHKILDVSEFMMHIQL